MMLTKILLPKKFKPFPHPPLTLFQVSSITADLNLDLNLMCKVRCFVSNRSKTIRMQVFFMFIKLRFALWPIKSNWIYDFSFSFGWTGYFLSCPPVFHYCKEKNFFDEILHLHRRASGCPFFLGIEQRRNILHYMIHFVDILYYDMFTSCWTALLTLPPLDSTSATAPLAISHSL